MAVYADAAYAHAVSGGGGYGAAGAAGAYTRPLFGST